MAKLGKGTQPVYELIRTLAPFVEKDRYLNPLIHAVKATIVDGRLMRVVNIEDTTKSL